MRYIWCFGKNFFEFEEGKIFITYEDLIKLAKVVYMQESEDSKSEAHKEHMDEFIKSLVKWNVITDDNLLIALIKHGYDLLALEYMGFYVEDINKELFLYCMQNGNEIFMKEALTKSAFDLLIFKEEYVIN